MSAGKRNRVTRHESDAVLRALGKGLKILRHRRGMTEQELADSVRVTRQAIRNAELGNHSIGVHQFLRMVWELDATDAEILELLRLDAKAREAA